MRSTTCASNRRIRSIAAACGDKWPALLRVPIAAAYVGMTEYRYRRIPQLASLIEVVWGMEVVRKSALDDILDQLALTGDVKESR